MKNFFQKIFTGNETESILNPIQVAQEFDNVETKLRYLHEHARDDQKKEIKDLLSQGNQVLLVPTSASTQIHLERARLQIQHVLKVSDKYLQMGYHIHLLKRYPQCRYEVMHFLSNDGGVPTITEGTIKILLDVCAQYYPTDYPKLRALLKNANAIALFEVWKSNFTSLNEKSSTKSLSLDFLDLEDKNNSLVDENSVATYLSSNQGEGMRNHIQNLPGGVAFLRDQIFSGNIPLHYWQRAYQYPAIALLSPDERLERFKRYTRIDNTVCYFLFSDDKRNGLLNLVGTDLEVLNKEQIKELFTHLTQGRNLNDAFLKEIPLSVLAQLGVERKKEKSSVA